MGLYRNIAGFLDGNRSVGLSLYQPGLITLDPSSINLPSPFTDPAAYQQQQAGMDAAYATEMTSRYDWLLSHPYTDIVAAGYYVTTDSGSIFQYTDASHTASGAYLGIDWIQKIENERGTAGALLLHMQEPALAKDTAGYQGGSSASFYEQAGVDPATQTVTDPIPAVQTLPAVQTAAPATATTTTTQTTTAFPVTTNNFLPLALIAGLAVVAVVGDSLLHNRRKLVYVGGVGALVYLIAKK